ncbi:MAG: hypothetical protein PHN60_02520 [Candidatus Gracilibacteria bacterium]|nr:hypothetical protein [Candidatus Gracilibacteria bacterium]
MKYTKYIATGVTFSLLSIFALASAATGDVTATGTTIVPTTTSTLEVKGAPRLIKKTTDSVVLEWDSVLNASAYIVKYSKSSVANSTDPVAQYDNETDQVTTTGAVITKLSSTNEKLAPATSYYFSLVAIDKDGKESDTFSDELMVTTEATEVTVSSGVTTSDVITALAIKDLVVSDDKTLSLSFNSDLSVDPVQVKITKTSDNSSVLVGTVIQDPTMLNTVVVTTLSALSPASSYTLTVLSAKDSLGNTIQEGVSGLKEFTTAETLKTSTSVVAPTSTADITALSGSVSPESATKVATGAKENLIVFIALILSLGIVYIYRRKLI